MYHITHAVKKGKLVSIHDVESGLACNCYCSKCNTQLVAKKGPIYPHHFAHYSDSDCTGESLLHILAKKIIKKNKYIYVPSFNLDEKYIKSKMNKQFYDILLRNIEPCEYVKVQFKDILVEEKIQNSNYRADIIGITNNKRELVIEIEVTHKIEDVKLSFLTSNNIPTLSINLSSFHHENFYNRLMDKEYRNFAIDVLKTSPRTWYVNNKYFEDKSLWIQRFNEFRPQIEKHLKEKHRKEQKEHLDKYLDKYPDESDYWMGK